MNKSSKQIIMLTTTIIVMFVSISYLACSLDDDDFGASQSELESNAYGLLNLRYENQEYGLPVKAGKDTTQVYLYGNVQTNIFTSWTRGYTGITLPQSRTYAVADFISTSVDSFKYEHNQYYHFSGTPIIIDISCYWETSTKIKYNIRHQIHWNKMNADGILVDDDYSNIYTYSFSKSPIVQMDSTLTPM